MRSRLLRNRKWPIWKTLEGQILLAAKQRQSNMWKTQRCRRRRCTEARLIVSAGTAAQRSGETVRGVRQGRKGQPADEEVRLLHARTPKELDAGGALRLAHKNRPIRKTRSGCRGPHRSRIPTKWLKMKREASRRS